MDEIKPVTAEPAAAPAITPVEPVKAEVVGTK